MGRVFLVEDQVQGDQLVALKTLRRALLTPEVEERFKLEFKAMSQLRHPNLVRVFDYGILDSDRQPFLTLEYLDGRDLSTYTPNELRPFLGEILAQLCRALDYIHARGLLHNDIKPQNIFLLDSPEGSKTPAYTAKLMDFGLARFQEQEEPSRRSGTLHYTAPEIFAGGKVDLRSDLYSLGVVLYRMATGALPFTAKDPVALIRAHREAPPPPPRGIDPTLPAGIERLILWLLEKAPEDRPRSAVALLRSLNEALGSDHALQTRESRESSLTGAALVGRDSEMEVLLAALRSLASEEEGRERAAGAGLILIGGESGVGKSRLLREFRTQIQTEGVQFLSGSCYETGGTVYQPFVEAFRLLTPAVRESLQDGSTGETETLRASLLAPFFPISPPPHRGGNKTAWRRERPRPAFSRRPSRC
jgi:serine/threonine-protein kinase